MFGMMLQWLIAGMRFICCGLDLVVWFGLITGLVCSVGGFILVGWGGGILILWVVAHCWGVCFWCGFV